MKIKSIELQNFGFFGKLDSLYNPLSKIGGKHTLLYGENGSGKTSLFRALQLLLESSFAPDEATVQQHFDKKHAASQVNIWTNTRQSAYIRAVVADNTSEKAYRISYTDTQIRQILAVQDSYLASDFIDYKVLLQFQDVSLFAFFEEEVFRKFKYIGTTTIAEQLAILQQGIAPERNEEGDLVYPDASWQASSNPNLKAGYKRFSVRKNDYKQAVKSFNDWLKDKIKQIENRANALISQKFGYDLRISLAYTAFTYTIHPTQGVLWENPTIELGLPHYQGKRVPRLKNFLNEAKWTAIGLALRLGILEERTTQAELKILVLDDILISLDMSNRDKVLQLIFSDYLARYQVFILTHDRVFFELVRFYINQNSSINDWEIFEMFVGKDANSSQEYPVIIPSKANYAEKAQSYFEAKDYTACAFYLRKEVERLVKQRLTEEVTRTFEEGQKFHSLEYLWQRMVERFEALSSPINEDLKTNFSLSKILVLNAQAHDNLAYPVYKVEIEKAMALIQAIHALPIPNKTILIHKGAKL